jgi:hypothetical protein
MTKPKETIKNSNKPRAIVFLVLTIAASLITCLPIANAKDYDNFAGISVAPNPVGVNQTVTVVFFLINPPPTARAGFDPAYNWNNFTVKITSPTGSTENYGPYVSDATGGAYFTFKPDEVGSYKLDFAFPGQTIGSNYYKPASATTNLTVQQEPIANYQTPPVPTDYWVRPIYGENRGWSTIGGNWLSSSYNNTGPFNPYTTAPNTAHIVWTKAQYIGGVVGGDYGDRNYYQGPVYSNFWNPPLIISGKLYYMERLTPGNGYVGMHCVDIRTGQEQWFKDISEIGSSVNFYGQVFDAYGVNGHGAWAFLWNLGANWTLYDANSGDLVYTITNPMTGVRNAPGTSYNRNNVTIGLPPTFAGGLDAAGSMIVYYIDGGNDWVLKWNSTLLLEKQLGGSSAVYSPPVGAVID